jgi:hypothetical protein
MKKYLKYFVILIVIVLAFFAFKKIEEDKVISKNCKGEPFYGEVSRVVSFEKFDDTSSVDVTPHTRVMLDESLKDYNCETDDTLLKATFDLGTYKGECKEIKEGDADLFKGGVDESDKITATMKTRIQCLYKNEGKEIRSYSRGDDFFLIGDLKVDGEKTFRGNFVKLRALLKK